MRKSKAYLDSKTNVARLQALAVRRSHITDGLYEVAARYDRCAQDYRLLDNILFLVSTVSKGVRRDTAKDDRDKDNEDDNKENGENDDDC